MNTEFCLLKRTCYSPDVGTAVCVKHMHFLYKLIIFNEMGGVLVNTFA